MPKGKIILIENKPQVLEFLRSRSKFKSVLPIAFSFDVEQILEKEKINFKKAEDYENFKDHPKIHKETLREMEKIFEILSFPYKKIDLSQLFYVELYQFITVKKRYWQMLKNIVKKRNPSQIFVFQRQERYGESDILSDLVENISGSKTKFLSYTFPREELKKHIKILGFLQDRLAKLRLGLLSREDKKIFLAAPKALFESTLAEIMKDGKIKVFRCSDAVLKSFFVGRKYVPFYQFRTKKKMSREMKEKLLNLKRKLEDPDIFKEVFKEKYLQVVLRKWFEGTIETKFSVVSGFIDEVSDLLKRNKIDLILLHQDVDLFQKTLVQVAKNFGVPTLVVQHGVCGHPIGFVPVSSDFFLSFGEQSKKRLMDWGCPKEKIILVDSPQFDKLYGRKKQKNEKIILYPVNSNDTRKTSPGRINQKKNEEILVKIFKSLKKYPDYKLVVKTKPGWILKDLPLILAKKHKFDNIEVIEKADNVELMARSSVVLVHSSAMALEAALLGKPVISIFYKDLEMCYPFAEDGWVKKAYTQKQLDNAIKKAIEGSSGRKALLKKDLCRLDGKASERAAKIINEAISERKNGI